MKHCIICRELKSDFTDEHVIPDSIGGYYHIYTVCKSCNSRMGSTIDSALSNHKFIEFYRHQNKIKGRSGSIPNPFQGTQSLQDDPTQKVRTDTDTDGKFIPRILPKITLSKNNNELEGFSVTLDGRDINELDKIIDSILVRNGINRSQIETSTFQEEIKPIIQGKFKVDIHRFKLAMLKIAYEFATDKIPEYFKDEQAKIISDILFKSDFDNLHEKVTIIGSGLDKEIRQPYENIINFEDGNHYLILFSSSLGLLCTISIFGVLIISIKLSNKVDYLDSKLLILKNNVASQCIELFDMEKISRKIYGPDIYNFTYYFENAKAHDEFFNNEIHPDFSFYSTDKGYPLFDENNNIIYHSIEDKLIQPQLISMKSDNINSIVTQYILDEKLYIKLLPIDKCFQIIGVEVKRNRVGTI